VKPNRNDVEDTFKKFASLIHASNRPLPHRYGSGQAGSGPAEQEMTGIGHDLSVLRKDGFLLESLKTIWDFASDKIKGDPVDDKTMIVSIAVPSGYESLLMCVDGALDPIDLPTTAHE
jgi:linoleate 10R-lipoxygenase